MGEESINVETTDGKEECETHKIMYFGVSIKVLFKYIFVPSCLKRRGGGWRICFIIFFPSLLFVVTTTLSSHVTVPTTHV